MQGTFRRQKKDDLMDIAAYGSLRVPGAAVSGRKSRRRGSLFALFVTALRKTRRREASRAIEKYAHLLPCAADASPGVFSPGQGITCPITQRLCVGDLSHLCKDYGCARKGGLSPRSEENF